MKILKPRVWALLPVLFLMAGDALGGVQRITECGTVIDEPGTYKLKSDLIGCPEGGIEISSSNVKLDLMNHEISCSGGFAGIAVAGSSEEPLRNVTIKKGHVSNCPYGIVLIFTEASKIMKMTSSGNLETGIAVWLSSDIVVQNNHAYANGVHGIQSWEGSNNLIKHNTTADNGGGLAGSGIDLVYETNSQIMCNRVHGNTDGILLAPSLDSEATSSGNLLHGNVVTGNVSGIGMMGFAWDGFYWLDIPSSNTVRSNVVEANGWFDVFEIYFDLVTEDILPNPEDTCMNNWVNNQHGPLVFGPDGCFGESVMLDQDDVCALDAAD